MQSISKEQIDILVNLQKIETDSTRIRSVLGGVDEKIDSLDEKLMQYQNGLDEKEAALEEVKSKYKSYEDDMRDNEARIQKSQETLKIVTTNKEYQVLLREIDDNKKKNSRMEEVLIEFLDEIEVAEKEVEERRNSFLQLKSQVEEDKEKILENSVEERQELELILSKRDEIASKVEPKILDRYNKVMKMCNGLAVVHINGNICGGCHLNIPPQLAIEVQKGGSLIFCPQCQRMLFWKDAEEAEEA